MGRFRGRTSGANIPNKPVYVCAGCNAQYPEQKPTQCNQCGRMDFTRIASKAEARRLGELQLMMTANRITDLETQPKFGLHVYTPTGQKVKIGEYWGDFRYQENGATVVEDVKGGADTDMSAWKRKHCEAEHGVKIQVIRR